MLRLFAAFLTTFLIPEDDQVVGSKPPDETDDDDDESEKIGPWITVRYRSSVESVIDCVGGKGGK